VAGTRRTYGSTHKHGGAPFWWRALVPATP